MAPPILKARHWLGALGVAVAALVSPAIQAAAEPQKPTPSHPSTPQIAIILDDLGYKRAEGERAIRLPGAVTLAILPYLAHSKALATLATAEGKEFLLHAPMEPRNQVRWEERGLSSAQPQEDQHQALLEMLAALPQAAGVNNHMGSKFTEDQTSMNWLMAELKYRQLFFVDSVTTPASLAWASARAAGVPTVKRDIFLDNIPDAEAIARQLHKSIAIARTRGYALAIGHPHQATLEVLEEYLPKLPELGVELVPVSRLIATAQRPAVQLATKSHSTAEATVGRTNGNEAR